MPGYLEGQNPDLQDAVAIAQHLSGETPLQGEPRSRADLDSDGGVTAADLLLMLRLAAGDLTLPLDLPRIHAVSPAIARPGQSLDLTGESFGDGAGQLAARARVVDGDWTSVAITWVSSSEATVQVPTPFPGLSEPMQADLRVGRQGVVSNTTTIQLTPGPVLHDLDRVASASAPTLALTGQGFETAGGSLEVLFGDQAVAPSSTSGTTGMHVVVPAGVTQPTSVAVRSGNVVSNALPFIPAFDLAGQVILPAGSPLSPDDLIAVAPGGVSAPVAGDGSFALNLAQTRPLSLEVRDAQAEPVLAALVHAGMPVLQIDASSTALWLVALLAGPLPMNLVPEDVEDLLNTLTGTPELATLTALISQHHASESRLLRLVQDLPQVRDAVEAALVVAREEISTRFGGDLA